MVPQLSIPTLEQSKKFVYEELLTTVQNVQDQLLPHPRNNFRPHVLRHRSLWLLSALLVAVKAASVVLLTYVPPVAVLSSAITSENILSLTNQSRSGYGLGALKFNNNLALAAQNKANDMAANQYFAHNSPSGKSPWDFISATGYKFQSAGENLAVNFLQAEEVNTAWMNSPGHRANILNGSFQEIGIGITTGQFQGSTVTFVVQMFGTPLPVVAAATPPTPAPAPQPAPTPPPQPAPAPIPAPQPTPTPPPQPAPAPTPTPPPPTPVPQPKPVTPSSPISFSLRGDNATPAKAETPASAPISIVDISGELNTTELQLTVLTSGPVTKVTAVSAERTFDLALKGSTWQGSIPAGQLAEGSKVMISIADASGQVISEPLAEVAQSTQESFGLLQDTGEKVVSFLGFELKPRQLQQTFYSLFIAAMLFVLMMAIGMYPRVQRLRMIAHTSIVIALATLLWTTL